MLTKIRGVAKADECYLSMIDHNMFLLEISEGVSCLMYLLSNLDQLATNV